MIVFFCHPGNVRGVVLSFGATTQFAVRRRPLRLTSSETPQGGRIVDIERRPSVVTRLAGRGQVNICFLL